MKYEIEAMEEVYYNFTVEAENEEKAEEKGTIILSSIKPDISKIKDDIDYETDLIYAIADLKEG